MEMKIATVVLSSALVVGAAFAALQQVRVDLRALLTGAGKGKAQWQIRDKGNQRQAELEVEAERLMPNSTYTIVIANNTPMSATTNAFGSFEIEQRFNTATRPTIVAGDSVSVIDGNSVTVLSGTFGN
jgi:hypothetical protein